ncbi:hypothetical protein [Algoriphagus chordae]|uniref:Lipocalin-like protein n=1 Tax=Algoriphagus chordae TaxID=237019 RepID=A0A2W7R4S0_9BACT|nr:hypothetical protein [Algoriphagus chordae]PZX53280.1 hypothetical protein LV85_01698 [Algoriphagus chordae]
MKHLSLLSLALIAFSFVACDKDDDPLPNQLVGNWEARYYVDSVDYWVVNTLEFKNDSVYQFRTTVRDSETGPDLGYRMYYDDRYEWDGMTFKYLPDLASWIDHREEAFYVPKQELLAGIMDYFYQPTARITFVENKEKLIFQDLCPENPAFGCEGLRNPIEYVRVN